MLDKHLLFFLSLSLETPQSHYITYMATIIARGFNSIVSVIAKILFPRRQGPKTTTHISYFRTSKRRPLSLQTVDLKVRMCCTGCVRIVRNAISKLRGVDSVEIELEMGRVRVIGYVERNKVLKAVRRAGKRAEFWPYPEPPLYFTSTQNYFRDPSKEFRESYNYYRHGYNAAEQHGDIPVGCRGDHSVSNMFNDDNVNACLLM